MCRISHYEEMLKTTIQFSYFSVCHVLFEFDEWPDHSVAGRNRKTHCLLEAAMEAFMDEMSEEEAAIEALMLFEGYTWECHSYLGIDVVNCCVCG